MLEFEYVLFLRNKLAFRKIAQTNVCVSFYRLRVCLHEGGGP